MFVHDNWIIGLLIVLILYLVYWHRRPKDFPPGPRGIPILGYFPLFKDPIKKLYELSKKYGPVMSVRMGAEDIIFLNDFGSINQAYVKQGSVFSGRPRFVVLESIRKGCGLGFADYGRLWKVQRVFGLTTLRGFGVGKKGMEKICLEESFHLNEKIRKSNGKPCNVSEALHNAVSNIICHVVVGKRFNYTDKEFVDLLHVTLHMFEDPELGMCQKLATASPMLKNVPPISWGINKIIKTTQNVIDWLDTIVQEHENTFDENNLRDFIDAFLAEKRRGVDSSFTKHQLLIYIHELCMGGTSTTAGTLDWLVLCLLHFPEVQRKLRKEIFEVIGSDGEISYAKKADMPYTNAFIQEMARYRTLSPIGLPHKTTEDTKLGRYFIPRNTKIISNTWAVHNDPKLWKNPEKFLPERFIDEKGNFISSKHVIPFSVGPRRCLGEQLARMEVFIFLVGMVQKFELFPDPESLPSLDDGNLGIAYVPKPFKVVVKQFSE